MTEPSPERPNGSKRRGAIQSGQQVRQMFDRIVPRYDLMNRIMTGGRDVTWRSMVANQAAACGNCALDIATGTGDLAFAIRKAGATDVIGVDFSEEMIEVARKKAPKHGKDVSFDVADALDLPFENGSFDACTVSFGLRNMVDYDAALREMRRVLRPGGSAIILEMTPFRRPFLGPFFKVYFEKVMPVVGGFLSGDRKAYRYLPSSVEAFPPAHELAEMMQAAGFEDVTYQMLGFGTVAIHSGEREAPSTTNRSVDDAIGGASDEPVRE